MPNHALTMPGLIIMLLTGIAFMLRRGMTPDKLRWMAAKLVLVGLVALNGAFEQIRLLSGCIAQFNRKG